MKRSLLAPLLATAAVFIASCDRTATVARPHSDSGHRLRDG